METTSNKIWGKLVALRPENQNISFIIKPDEPNQYQVDGEWKIYQDAAGDTKIMCLSASCIKVNDVWLGMNQEKALKGGEMIAFSEEKNIADNNFDYVYCLANAAPVDKIERKRDEDDESKYRLLYQKMKKFTNEMNQEFHCAICIEIISECTTLHPCLHNFCYHCVIQFQSSKECPLCREKIMSWKKNPFLQRIIDSTTSVLHTSSSFEEFKQQINLNEEPKINEENGKYIGTFSSDGKREGQGKITYDDGSIYDGAWKNGQREGKGKMTYKNGDIYEGNWKNDKREGKGVLTVQWCYNCKGEWIEDILQPFVTLEYVNGDHYFGEVKDGMKHGNGVLLSSNSTSNYNGSWFQDQRQGWGKEIHPTRTYEGNWMDNKMHGHGKMEFRSVGNLKGDWCEGKISEGVLTRTNGDMFKGKWNNYSAGSGTISFANSGKQFEGSWKRSSSRQWTLTLKNSNVYQEIGASSSKIRQFRVRYANGNQYTGMIEMENLYLQGKGKVVFHNGDEYEGEFHQSRPHGNGKYTCKKDGSVYEGQYKNGKKDGIGTLTNADGSKWTGEWKDDEKVIKQEITPENSTNEIANLT